MAATTSSPFSESLSNSTINITTTALSTTLDPGVEPTTTTWERLLWLPYFVLSTVLVFLACASFCHFHYRNKDKYRGEHRQTQTLIPRKKYRVTFNSKGIPCKVPPSVLQEAKMNPFVLQCFQKSQQKSPTDPSADISLQTLSSANERTPVVQESSLQEGTSSLKYTEDISGLGGIGGNRGNPGQKCNGRPGHWYSNDGFSTDVGPDESQRLSKHTHGGNSKCSGGVAGQQKGQRQTKSAQIPRQPKGSPRRKLPSIAACVSPDNVSLSTVDSSSQISGQASSSALPGHKS